MAKAKGTAFFCQNCGYESAKWMGQCPACREWNTFAEEPLQVTKSGGKTTSVRRDPLAAIPQQLNHVQLEETIRTGTGMA